MTAAPEKVTVERGKTKDVELVASASYATLKVGTSDGKGLVYLDDKLVGEGTFTSDVPSGPHSLRITREGYDPFEETDRAEGEGDARADHHAEALVEDRHRASPEGEARPRGHLRRLRPAHDVPAGRHEQRDAEDVRRGSARGARVL